MAEKKTALWKRLVGYLLFTLFALVTGFFISFPYDALRDRVRLEADRAGYFVRIGSLGPGFFAVRAADLQVSKKADSDPPPEALRIDSVSVGPSLFPPGVAVTAKLMGGSVTARASGLSTTRLVVDVKGLDLSKGNLKGFSGIDFAGTVNGQLDVRVPRVPAAPNTPPEPDLAQASGSLTLSTQGLAVNGGTANITIPQYGPDPSPFDLPRIVLGDVTGKVTLDKGAATIDKLEGSSADLELKVTGTVKLAKRLEYSEQNIELRLKPDPEFQKRLGMLGAALSFMGADPQDPTWRLGRLSGYLGRPQFR
jgi:type II secretion system protein N